MIVTHNAAPNLRHQHRFPIVLRSRATIKFKAIISALLFANSATGEITEAVHMGQVFRIGTVDAYSAKYSALVAYKILELFQY